MHTTILTSRAVRVRKNENIELIINFNLTVFCRSATELIDNKFIKKHYFFIHFKIHQMECAWEKDVTFSKTISSKNKRLLLEHMQVV